jgi:hypothetical protein
MMLVVVPVRDEATLASLVDITDIIAHFWPRMTSHCFSE